METRQRIIDFMADGGAPWVHALGLEITLAEPGMVRFTLDVTRAVTHGGGVLCGQAIMAGMDTGMVYVMVSLRPDDTPSFTTVSLNTVFERGVPSDIGTIAFEARAAKAGRSLVFGEIEAFLPDGKRAASATTTYMWLT